eukprot:COSAG01_NODE_16000_length_1279_cov_1.905932_2_plen_122_part_00
MVQAKTGLPYPTPAAQASAALGHVVDDPVVKSSGCVMMDADMDQRLQRGAPTVVIVVDSEIARRKTSHMASIKIEKLFVTVMADLPPACRHADRIVFTATMATAMPIEIQFLHGVGFFSTT